MKISTNSNRLAWVARACRMFPPAAAGVFLRLYPVVRAPREHMHFEARSSLGDITLASDSPDVVAVHFAICGYYEWLNITVANTVCGPGDCIVEIGANIGTETGLYARIVGKTGVVVAFEPAARNVAALRALIERNRLTQVRVIQAAVTDRAGPVRFELTPAPLNSGMGRICQTDGSADHADVPGVTLDEMHESGELPAPRMIVIDVQGAELMALRGAERLLRSAKPIIVWEAHEESLSYFNTSTNDVASFLSACGYQHWEITRMGLRDFTSGSATLKDCLSMPNSPHLAADAKRISGRMRKAAWLPLIRGLNPAVVARQAESPGGPRGN